jgi:hypothetical protein
VLSAPNAIVAPFRRAGLLEVGDVRQDLRQGQPAQLVRRDAGFEGEERLVLAQGGL